MYAMVHFTWSAKKSVLYPVHRIGDKKTINNYRPVFLTSTYFGNVLEHFTLLCYV